MCVALLQLSLNETNAGYGLPTDGQFGPDTRVALLDFQGRTGLPADGNAGAEVIAALIGQVGDHSVLDLGGPSPYAPPAPAAGAGGAQPKVIEAAAGVVPVKPGLGVYRVGYFIMQDKYGAGVGGFRKSGSGDGRGFDTAMTPSMNRVYVEINYENGTGRVVVNYSCNDDRTECVDLVPIDEDRVKVSRDDSRLFPSETTKVHINVENSRERFDGLPRIRGDLQFTPTPQGTFMLTGSISRFPSFEVYRDNSDGSVSTVVQHEQARVIGAAALFAPGTDLDFGRNVGPNGVDGDVVGP